IPKLSKTEHAQGADILPIHGTVQVGGIPATACGVRLQQSISMPQPARSDVQLHASHADQPKRGAARRGVGLWRSEEHTSELQSLRHLVCRLLLEKKNNTGLPSSPS